MFEVYMIPANEGDAYHVAYGPEKGKKHHLIIDGGPSSCGRKVADIMKTIIGAGETMDVFLTHIDSDHIEGLTKALQFVKKDCGAGKLFSAVEKVFYNTCREYQKRKNLPVTDDDYLAEKNTGDVSVAQGIKLLDLLDQLKLGGKLVYSLQGNKEERHGAELYFISPSEAQMEKLNNDKEKYLKKLEKKNNGNCSAGQEPFAYESLASFKDIKLEAEENRSPNLSSLAFLLKYEDILVAFLGDARADVCVEGLACIREKYKTPEGETMFPDPCPVDFMKVPHHGSGHSNHDELFTALPTDYYFISTNGGGGKSYGCMPSKDVLARMVENHPEHKINIFVNDNWWEKGQMKNFFTEEDKKDYLNPKDPKINLLDTSKRHYHKRIKEGLDIYGEKK